MQNAAFLKNVKIKGGKSKRQQQVVLHPVATRPLLMDD